MTIIEPHIHMISRTTDEYRLMYEKGIRVCVEPSFWQGSDRRYAGSFFDYFRLNLEFETVRAARFGVDHYGAVALNPKEAGDGRLADEVLAGMQEFLGHERCVALGEIGLNENTEDEIRVFRRQLLMAEELDMPVIIHLPHGRKVQGTEIIVGIIEAEGVTQDRILIDHNTEDSMSISRRTACYCGLTVYPYSKLTPQRVSNIIREFEADRVMVNSSADWGVSDPLALVRVVDYLAQNGHPDEVIRKLTYDNAMSFYSNSPRWKPVFDLEPVPVSEYQR